MGILFESANRAAKSDVVAQGLRHLRIGVPSRKFQEEGLMRNWIVRKLRDGATASPLDHI